MRGDEELNLSRDGLDERIDRALQSYAEPPEFPETRVVLARVRERARAAETQKRGWWIWGAVAAAGLAVIVALGVVWMMRSPRRAEIAWAPKAPGVVESNKISPHRLKPKSSQSANGTAQTVPLQSMGGHGGRVVARKNGASRASGARVARAVAPERLPKMEVFPTPRPLSKEEQALVGFANNVPEKMQQQVLEAQKHLGDPIVIAELKIAPLEISGGEQHSR